jgi:hypothetical protein
MTGGTIIETVIKSKNGLKDLKEKRDSPSSRSLREILQQGAGTSGAPLRGPAAPSKPAVEIAAKDTDEPVVRNLSEEKSETILLGVSSNDILLQGTSTSSIPTAEGLRHIVSGVGELILTKKVLSGCSRQKLKKARAKSSEAGTVGIQQSRYAGASKQGEHPPKSLRDHGRRAVPLQKRQEHQKCPGTPRDLVLTWRLRPT